MRSVSSKNIYILLLLSLLLLLIISSLLLIYYSLYSSGTKSRLAVIISVLYVTEFNFRFIILSWPSLINFPLNSSPGRQKKIENYMFSLATKPWYVKQWKTCHDLCHLNFPMMSHTNWNFDNSLLLCNYHSKTWSH